MTKSQKWKSPGIDKVPNFWLNSLSSSHFTFTRLLNEIMLNPEKGPKWICEGTTYNTATYNTYNIAKSNDAKDPKSYRPITCLSTTYKLLTSVLTGRTYYYAICWNLNVNVDVVCQYTNRCEIYIIIVKIKPLHAHLNHLVEKCQVHVAKMILSF